jgi:transcription elongation GreA/GreB family factor
MQTRRVICCPSVPYRIVGIDEADPQKGTLSYAAPLAQALIGKEIGDSVVVGGHEETIVSIA